MAIPTLSQREQRSSAKEKQHLKTDMEFAMSSTSHKWSVLFFAAAAFNFCIGLPLMLLPWTFSLAFFEPVHGASDLAPKLWGDFGFCVTLIGIGYLMAAFDLNNRALVWLGILAKAFDVIVLTSRWITGITRPLVLFPAAIDAVFIALFLLFLVRTSTSGVKRTNH
jgi:hypothetical protein